MIEGWPMRADREGVVWFIVAEFALIGLIWIVQAVWWLIQAAFLNPSG